MWLAFRCVFSENVFIDASQGLRLFHFHRNYFAKNTRSGDTWREQHIDNAQLTLNNCEICSFNVTLTVDCQNGCSIVDILALFLQPHHFILRDSFGVGTVHIRQKTGKGVALNKNFG